MRIFQILFRLCQSIMSIPIDLLGYTITLWQVMIFGFVGFVCLYFVFSLFR